MGNANGGSAEHAGSSSTSSSSPSPAAPSPSPKFFAPQEKRSKEAEFHTNVHNFRKMAQDLLEKGYNEKGFSLSTMVKCLEKNSEDPEDIPYCRWRVGIDSMASSVGNPYCYCDLSTRIDFKASPLCKKVYGLDIIVENKPKVSGDIVMSLDDYVKLIAGVGWRDHGIGWQDHVEGKLELLFFVENLALRVKASGFQMGFSPPERLDIAAAVYKSWVKLGAEASYDMTTWRFMSYCIGGAIQTNDFLASVTYWRDSLIGSCVKKFSSKLDMGIEVSKPISSEQQCTMTFGVCKGEPGHLYKMKINNLGVFNGSIERTLWPKAVVSVSSQVNLKNLLNLPRFGLKVLFNPPAVTQTYDIGTERWEKS